VLAEITVLELRRLSWRRAKRGVEAVAHEFTKYDLLTYSSAIAFQVIYAVLPLAMLALAALGLFGWESLYTEHIAPALRSTLSRDAYDIANRTALRVMSGKRFWWTTLGLAVTLWGAGAAVRAMITPLNGVYGARETRSWLRRIAVTIAAGAAAIILVLSALLIALLSPLVDLHGLAALGFGILRWAATLVLLRVVPAKKRPIEWISIGSALCAVCWIVTTVGFGAYVSAVTYSSFYGALAGVVLLLIYLHLASIAFLLGVVVDALLRDEVTKRGAGR
jgi:membrane protein